MIKKVKEPFVVKGEVISSGLNYLYIDILIENDGDYEKYEKGEKNIRSYTCKALIDTGIINYLKIGCNYSVVLPKSIYKILGLNIDKSIENATITTISGKEKVEVLSDMVRIYIKAFPRYSTVENAVGISKDTDLIILGTLALSNLFISIDTFQSKIIVTKDYA
jgi:hypothetical protein